MAIEVDDKEYEEIIAEQRHRELTETLKGLATAISQKEDKVLADALKELAKSKGEIAKAIRDIPKPERPDVKVNFDHEKFVTSMDKIADRIEQSINKAVTASEKPLVESFDFQYDNWGGIKTAKVNYRNQISKPKYQA